MAAAQLHCAARCTPHAAHYPIQPSAPAPPRRRQARPSPPTSSRHVHQAPSPAAAALACSRLQQSKATAPVRGPCRSWGKCTNRNALGKQQPRARTHRASGQPPAAQPAQRGVHQLAAAAQQPAQRGLGGRERQAGGGAGGAGQREGERGLNAALERHRGQSQDPGGTTAGEASTIDKLQAAQLQCRTAVPAAWGESFRTTLPWRLPSPLPQPEALASQPTAHCVAGDEGARRAVQVGGVAGGVAGGGHPAAGWADQGQGGLEGTCQAATPLPHPACSKPLPDAGDAVRCQAAALGAVQLGEARRWQLRGWARGWGEGRWTGEAAAGPSPTDKGLPTARSVKHPAPFCLVDVALPAQCKHRRSLRSRLLAIASI